VTRSRARTNTWSANPFTSIGADVQGVKCEAEPIHLTATRKRVLMRISSMRNCVNIIRTLGTNNGINHYRTDTTLDHSLKAVKSCLCGAIDDGYEASAHAKNIFALTGAHRPRVVRSIIPSCPRSFVYNERCSHERRRPAVASAPIVRTSAPIVGTRERPPRVARHEPGGRR